MGLDNMNQLMAGIMVIAGAMSLYYAFTGSGKVYQNDYPKGMQEEANKLLRLFLWIIAPIALTSGVLELAGFSWAYFIGLAIFPMIIVYYILFRRKFKEYLKKK